jgi:hypothetical protein
MHIVFTSLSTDAPPLLLLCWRSSWQTFALPMISYIPLANPLPDGTAMSQLRLAFSLLSQLLLAPRL